MLKTLLASTLILLSANAMAEAPTDYNSCLSYVETGAYPSGITQKRCETKFVLPSPFMFKCTKVLDENTNDTAILPCLIYLQSLEKARTARFIRIGFYKEI